MLRSPSKRKMLWRSHDGVTAIEFAIVAPVLLMLVFSIIEFSLIMVVSNVMESATVVSSRLGKTGFVEEGKTREDTILDSIADRAGALINPDLLTVTSKFYSAFDEIGDPEPYVDANSNGVYDAGEAYTDINGNGMWDTDMGAAGYGGPEDIVVYTVSYPWAITTPIMSGLIGDGAGNYIVTAHAVVKNEPYNE